MTARVPQAPTAQALAAQDPTAPAWAPAPQVVPALEEAVAPAALTCKAVPVAPDPADQTAPAWASAAPAARPQRSSSCSASKPPTSNPTGSPPKPISANNESQDSGMPHQCAACGHNLAGPDVVCNECGRSVVEAL